MPSARRAGAPASRSAQSRSRPTALRSERREVSAAPSPASVVCPGGCRQQRTLYAHVALKTVSMIAHSVPTLAASRIQSLSLGKRAKYVPARLTTMPHEKHDRHVATICRLAHRGRAGQRGAAHAGARLELRTEGREGPYQRSDRADDGGRHGCAVSSWASSKRRSSCKKRTTHASQYRRGQGRRRTPKHAALERRPSRGSSGGVRTAMSPRSAAPSPVSPVRRTGTG